MKLGRAVADANLQGRRGLIVYGIPGFPDPDSWDAILDLLDAEASVSIVETTYPVSAGFSSHANETLRRAHRVASAANAGRIRIRGTKPSLLVLYRETLGDQSFEAFTARTRADYEGVVLEWDEPDDEGLYAAAGRGVGVEVIQCVGPWMSDARTAALAGRAEPGGLVYLMSAEMTGAELFLPGRIEACAKATKLARSDVLVAAGFGIRTGDDVRRLREAPSLDAVIVGTAFIEACERGPSAAADLLADLKAAL